MDKEFKSLKKSGEKNKENVGCTVLLLPRNTRKGTLILLYSSKNSGVHCKFVSQS